MHAFFCALALGAAVTAVAQDAEVSPLLPTEELQLRHSEPLAAVIADMSAYIPQCMRAGGVPGLTIALVRDGEVVWTAGFGVTSSVFGKPMTKDSVFQVASNSKVVTTYVALRLAQLRGWSLGEPVAGFLHRPWLPPGDTGERITLRQLVSHSSGLSDSLLPVSKHLEFEPGSRFQYSGVGFLYLQELIEQATGTDLEQAAQELVLGPLGMHSSSFVNRPDLVPRLAPGHISYLPCLIVFLVPFIGALVCCLWVTLVAQRLRSGQWRLTPAGLVAAMLVAAVMVVVLIVWAMGAALPEMVRLTLLSATVFTALLVAAHLVAKRLLRSRGEGRTQRVVIVCVTILTGCCLLIISGQVAGPMPVVSSVSPSAVGSLRTTAGDLATLLVELAQPSLLEGELAEEIGRPQTSINQTFSWGLGVGIQHSSQGEALWQNGQTFGYRSFMLIYPDLGLGVVVLCNSNNGFPVVYDIVHRAVGGADHFRHF
jgi:CubicO group peptidase (beta-lactamase class C family)